MALAMLDERVVIATRARLLAAAEEIVAKRGAGALSLESACLQTGVSRVDSRRAFRGRSELLVALHDELASRVRRSMYRAYLKEGSWLDGVRAALAELLCTLERDVPLARFMLLDCAIDEGPLPARHAEMLAQFARALERDRPPSDPARSPAYGAQAVIGAVAAILHGRLMEDPVPPLGGLVGPFTSMIAMPYLGVEAARGELTRGRVTSACGARSRRSAERSPRR